MTIGSSHFFSASGATGPQGAPGPEGPQGNIGSTGSTGYGPTGSTATKRFKPNDRGWLLLSDSSVTNDIAGFTLFDGSSITFDANIFRGNTLSASGITATGKSTGFSIFKSISENTLSLKKLNSTTGQITVTSDNYNVIINSDGTPLPITAITGGFLYVDAGLKSSIQAGFSGSSDTSYTHLILNATMGTTNCLVSFNRNPTTNTQDSVSSFNVIDKSITYFTGRSIGGFTGFPGVSGTTGEIFTFSLIVSDKLTSLPLNVYFRPEHSVLPPGKSIITLTTKNNGATIFAEVFHSGYNSEKNIPAYMQGVCVDYNTLAVAIGCTDHVEKHECIPSKTNGFIYFYPHKTCIDMAPAGTSFEIGNCCIRGLCTQVPKNLCLRWGGIYHGTTACNSVNCPNPCDQ